MHTLPGAAHSPVVSLKSAYLAQLPSPEIHLIEQKATSVASLVRPWVGRHPSIRPVRIDPVAITMAAAAPFCDDVELALNARVNLWIFALDDVFDEVALPPTDLAHLGEYCKAAVRGDNVAPTGGDLADALDEIVADLGRYPLFRPLHCTWANAFVRMVDGMIRENTWREAFRGSNDRAFPTYRDYISNGRFSVGGPGHIWTNLILIDDPSTPDHLDLLRPMERAASTAIRLANDLRSNRKERSEQKVNGVRILAAQPGDASGEGVALRRMALEIDRCLGRLDRFQIQAHTLSKRPEAAIVNIAGFVCDYYTRYDYHTLMPTASARRRNLGDCVEARDG